MKFTVIIMEMLFSLINKKKRQQVFIIIRLIFKRNISERIPEEMYPTGQKM